MHWWIVHFKTSKMHWDSKQSFRFHVEVDWELFTYQRAVEEEGGAQQDAHTQCQDEGPSAAPAQRAAVTGWADQRREHQTQDGAQEPRQAVILLWKTWEQHKHTDLMSLPAHGFSLSAAPKAVLGCIT